MSTETVPVVELPVSEPIHYKDFMQRYLASLNREEHTSAKTRFKMAAAAWQRLDEVKKLRSSGSSGVVKKKSVAQRQQSTPTAHIKKWSDVGSLLQNFGAKGGSETVDASSPAQTFSSTGLTPSARRGKIVVHRTKANQRALNNVARQFQKEVAGGRVLSAHDAFLAGLNAWTNLAH
jgi:hypothetical protein